MIPGRYRREKSAESPWHQGTLHLISNDNQLGTQHWRWVNDAKAVWTCVTGYSEDSNNDDKSSFDPSGKVTGSLTLVGSVIDSPAGSNGSETNNINDSSSSLNASSSCAFPVSSPFKIEVVVASQDDQVTESIIVVKLTLDQQVFVRTGDPKEEQGEGGNDSLSVGTAAITASLGPGAISVATPQLIFAVDRVTRAETAYRAGRFDAATALINEVKHRLPIGSIAWKNEVRFLISRVGASSEGFWFDVYTTFRILEFCLRQRAKHQKNSASSRSDSSNHYNITVICIPQTTTTAPDTPEEHFSAAATASSTRRTHKLDPRLAKREEAAAAVVVADALFWWSELVSTMSAAGSQQLKVKVNVVHGDDAAVPKSCRTLSVDPNPAKSVDDLQQKLPQFPTAAFLREQEQKQSSSSSSLFSDTDQFFVIYPRAEPHEWMTAQQQQHNNNEDFVRFTSGGVFFIGSVPATIIDDFSLLQTTAKISPVQLDSTLRRHYFAHWLLHEVSHAFFQSPRLFASENLEPEPHSWFEREKWPADFESESGLETDYFFEAIEKRYLVAHTKHSFTFSGLLDYNALTAATMLPNDLSPLLRNNSHWPLPFKLRQRRPVSLVPASSSSSAVPGAGVYVAVSSSPLKMAIIVDVSPTVIEWCNSNKVSSDGDSLPESIAKLSTTGRSERELFFSSISSSSNGAAAASTNITASFYLLPVKFDEESSAVLESVWVMVSAQDTWIRLAALPDSVASALRQRSNAKKLVFSPMPTREAVNRAFRRFCLGFTDPDAAGATLDHSEAVAAAMWLFPRVSVVDVSRRVAEAAANLAVPAVSAAGLFSIAQDLSKLPIGEEDDDEESEEDEALKMSL